VKEKYVLACVKKQELVMMVQMSYSHFVFTKTYSVNTIRLHVQDVLMSGCYLYGSLADPLVRMQCSSDLAVQTYANGDVNMYEHCMLIFSSSDVKQKVLKFIMIIKYSRMGRAGGMFTMNRS
jgi:hypothetical protein